eukprot:Skav236099  [mRNA]  locus=scaffold1166:204428:205717:- [translate_table: standard]
MPFGHTMGTASQRCQRLSRLCWSDDRYLMHIVVGDCQDSSFMVASKVRIGARKCLEGSLHHTGKKGAVLPEDRHSLIQCVHNK